MRKTKIVEANAKQMLDRLFEKIRTKYKIYAFQNKNGIEIDCFNEQNLKYFITTKPKRDFFVDDNLIVEEGFNILFNNLKEEELKEIKIELITHLGNKFYFFIDKNNISSDSFKGKIKVTNLKRMR